MRQWVASIGMACLGVALMGTISNSDAQQAAGAEVASSESAGRPAPSTDTFGQTQYVLAGEPIVPPRDYSKGIEIPQPQDYDPIESGKIYDVAFVGIQDGKIQFEVRGYSIADLDHPDTGQTIEFPADQKTIVIRDLTIEVDEVMPNSLTYAVQLS